MNICIKKNIISFGDSLLFDNTLTKWIEKEGRFLNEYINDECNPEHTPKKKTAIVIGRLILFVSVVTLFGIFSNILATGLWILEGCR